MQSMQSLILNEIEKAAFPLEVGQTQVATNVGRIYLRRLGHSVGIVSYDFQSTYVTLSLKDGEDKRVIWAAKTRYERPDLIAEFVDAIHRMSQEAVERYPLEVMS